MDQERKAQLAPVIKAVCSKYGVKASIAVRNHSTLVVTVTQGKIDFIKNFNEVNADKPRPAHLPFQPAADSIDVNHYWYHEHFSGDALAFLQEVIPAMKGPEYFDHSDIQTDYFHCSHYIDVNIGRWNRPYVFEG
jgi:hypothetical protein